jgi:hypothetical protein
MGQCAKQWIQTGELGRGQQRCVFDAAQPLLLNAAGLKAASFSLQRPTRTNNGVLVWRARSVRSSARPRRRGDFTRSVAPFRIMRRAPAIRSA